MKVKFGARCTGMNQAEEEVIEMPDETTDKDMESALLDFAVQATSFDSWWYKCDDEGNEIKD